MTQQANATTKKPTTPTPPPANQTGCGIRSLKKLGGLLLFVAFVLIIAGVFMRLYNESIQKSTVLFYVAFCAFALPGGAILGYALFKGRSSSPAPSTKIAKGDFLPEPTVDKV